MKGDRPTDRDRHTGTISAVQWKSSVKVEDGGGREIKRGRERKRER